MRRPSFTDALALATLVVASLLGLAGPIRGQEESQPPGEQAPPQEESTEEAPTEEMETPPGESSEASDEGATESTDADDDTDRQKTPEEIAREEARRKREERAAKRQAKKDREKEKREDKVARGEASYEDQLARLLSKGYEALAEGRYRNALQAFRSRLELEMGVDFEARMGVARTLLAMERKVEAIEEALKAARDAQRNSDRSDALVFAGDVALRSVPRDETTNAPLPGSELYVTTAWRYYVQALVADPSGAAEARSRLDEIFPTPPDERTERLYARYLATTRNAEQQHAAYLAAAYEALISGGSSNPVAVVGGITPPKKTRGRRPTYPRPLDTAPPRRLIASLIIEADGTVSAVRVLNGVDLRHDRDARAIWQEWTFEPARLPDGTPVPVHYLAGASPILTEPLPELPTAEIAEGDEADDGPDGAADGAADGAPDPDAESETDESGTATSEDPPDERQPEDDE